MDTRRDGGRKKKELGQTLIETVFVLVFLLLLIFGIAEFARAWYVKNSLNNAARVGARVGAVTPSLINGTDMFCNAIPATTAGAVAQKVCDSLSMSASAKATVKVTVAVDVTGGTDTGVLDAGDTVTVTVTKNYPGGVSPFSLLPWLKSLTSLSSQASMRYEL